MCSRTISAYKVRGGSGVPTGSFTHHAPEAQKHHPCIRYSAPYIKGTFCLLVGLLSMYITLPRSLAHTLLRHTLDCHELLVAQHVSAVRYIYAWYITKTNSAHQACTIVKYTGVCLYFWVRSSTRSPRQNSGVPCHEVFYQQPAKSSKPINSSSAPRTYEHLCPGSHTRALRVCVLLVLLMFRHPLLCRALGGDVDAPGDPMHEFSPHIINSRTRTRLCTLHTVIMLCCSKCPARS